MTALSQDLIDNDSPGFNFSDNVSSCANYEKIKRYMDVALSMTLMVVLLPVFVLVAAAIAIESKGGVFFYQERVGKNGRLFRFWKFRSMRQDAEQIKKSLMEKNEMQGGVIFKMKNDPRITRVGRLIRKFSLDELPQLWNVIIGDMSLVGPRPALPSEVATYTPSQRQRLNITPGITCTWQVSGRSNIPFDQQVVMDTDYIANSSFLLDLKLLIKTIPAVVLGKGAF